MRELKYDMSKEIKFNLKQIRKLTYAIESTYEVSFSKNKVGLYDLDNDEAIIKMLNGISNVAQASIELIEQPEKEGI